MRVKVQYQETTYRTAEVNVDEGDLLEYIQTGGGDHDSLDEVRDDEGEDFEYLVREYLEEAEHVTFEAPAEAGPAELRIDRVEVLG